MPGLKRFVEPSVVASHFHLTEGDVVADFGAGSGYFLRALSGAVGSSGIVYACEIQKQLVEALGRVAEEQHLPNIRPLWSDLEEIGGIPLGDSTLDTGLLINTLFQLENKPTALAEMARLHKPGATFFIIDWTESFAGLGPHPSAVVTEADARALAEAAGFSFARSFDAGDHHYGIALRKS
jgi:ubiquinone/menaquinone biosynthesis C-methylase UbiE